MIAEFINEPLFSDDYETLMRRLQDSGDDMPDVIVNLKGVTMMNSSNLAQLLKLRKRLLANSRRLRVCSVGDNVWSIFIVTGLDKLFEFTDDVSTSLTSLQIEQ